MGTIKLSVYSEIYRADFEFERRINLIRGL